jgi:hypothetical protein
MHDPAAETPGLGDRLQLSSPVNAESLLALFQPFIATNQSTMRNRLNPPLQYSSGFNPVLVSLQI